MLAAMQKRGAHVCSEDETKRLERLCNVRGHMNPDVVGLDPGEDRARWRASTVPRRDDASCSRTRRASARSSRSRSRSSRPLLSRARGRRLGGGLHGLDRDRSKSGGLGHTLGLWARDQKVLDAWFLEKPANRIVVNGPTSQGAVGYSTNLMPSMSLGCGPQAGNITSDNISARHLINVKRAAFLRRDWETIWKRGPRARGRTLGGERAPRGSGLPGDPRGSRGAASARPGTAGRRSGSAPEGELSRAEAQRSRD